MSIKEKKFNINVCLGLVFGRFLVLRLNLRGNSGLLKKKQLEKLVSPVKRSA